MVKIKPPGLETDVGLETYLSAAQGIGGKIKQIPDDFVVDEVAAELRQGDGEYVHFTLEKKNWDTLRAIKEISKRLRVSRKRLGFAGTKDRRAITRQRVSVWNIPIEDLKKINIRDITLSEFSQSPERINLGYAWGNKFSIVARNIDLEADELKARVGEIANELKDGFPNFFGLQRFGIQRPITHRVGRAILKTDFKEAVMTYLAGVYETEREEAVKARKYLRDTNNFREAIKIFPKNLGYENAMLNHLVNHETDFIGALRKLPKKLRWMFVHAYQSYIFNRALSHHIKEGDVPENLDLLGYNSKPDDVSAKILEEDDVSLTDFKTPSMPELSSEGKTRDCLIRAEDFEASELQEDELNEGKKKLTLKFKLLKGSYATTMLREFMKNEWW